MFAQAISESFRFSNAKWLLPGFEEWVFNLDHLRKKFTHFADLEWLTGMIAIEPKIDIKEVDRRSKVNRSEEPSYTAEARFYVLPHLVLGHQLSTQIPDAISTSLQEFRRDHPEPRRTAFLMMQFGATEDHGRIVDAIRTSLKPHGISALRADDKVYHEDLFPNVQTYMYGCGFGIAVFERIESERFNPNVALEVGYMTALGKKVCLLKDKTLTQLHADLLGKLYEPFDTRNPEKTIGPRLNKWLEDRKYIVPSPREEAS